MKQCLRRRLTAPKLVAVPMEAVPSVKTATTTRIMKIDFKREFREARASRRVYLAKRPKPGAQTDQAEDGRLQGCVIWFSRSVIKSFVMVLLLIRLLTIGLDNVEGECFGKTEALFLVDSTRLCAPCSVQLG